MNDLFDRLHQRHDTGAKNNECDDDRAEIFHTAMPERMLLIRRAVCQFDTNDGDDGRDGISQIVHSIQNNRNRTRQQSYYRLKNDQENIRRNADNACAGNSLFSSYTLCCCRFIHASSPEKSFRSLRRKTHFNNCIIIHSSVYKIKLFLCMRSFINVVFQPKDIFSISNFSFII